MILVFWIATILTAHVIQRTGVWTEESSRFHDLLGFILLGLITFVFAYLFAPLTPPTPTLTWVPIQA